MYLCEPYAHILWMQWKSVCIVNCVNVCIHFCMFVCILIVVFITHNACVWMYVLIWVSVFYVLYMYTSLQACHNSVLFNAGVVDKLFARVGASDNVVKHMSTFHMEMAETANILSFASPRSFVILDEIGKGE